ncbi:hypothetical protein HK097_000389 [Rhizophlyctis rosea]|uniref:PLOD1-3-like GT domain-containing protein n=1 Tax=Rhizophlyctis rosea TaxID=64517 RepID=A0AAD5SDP1_9FUNG|nr:hypothetical protein HK097_000389 [Rhizophlyctis rosea]
MYTTSFRFPFPRRRRLLLAYLVTFFIILHSASPRHYLRSWVRAWKFVTGNEARNLVPGALRSPTFWREKHRLCKVGTLKEILEGGRGDWAECERSFLESRVPTTLYKHGRLHDPSGKSLHIPFTTAIAPPAPLPSDPPPHLTGHCDSSTTCPLVWVTYATFCNAHSNRFSQQVSSLRIPLAVLDHHEPWRGYGGRIRAYHNYLLTLPPDTIVIISDTYDVMIQPSCSASDIVASFKEKQKEVLFSSEVFCWPNAGQMNEYPPAPPPPSGRLIPAERSEYKYLNAGTFIGYVKDLLNFFAAAYNSDCDDDQGAFTNQFLRLHRESNNSASIPVALDYYQDVFMTIQGTRWEDLDFVEEEEGEGKRVRNRRTGGMGCVIHQNGDKSNLLLERVAREIGVESFGEGFHQ